MSRIMKYKNYHEQKDAENIQRLREVLTTLPSFVSDYFRATEMSTSTTTRLSYAYDIRIFFRFLVERNPMYKHYTTAVLPMRIWISFRLWILRNTRNT